MLRTSGAGQRAAVADDHLRIVRHAVARSSLLAAMALITAVLGSSPGVASAAGDWPPGPTAQAVGPDI